MASEKSNGTDSTSWARSTWKRAFEGVLISPMFGNNLIIGGDLNDGVLLDVNALDMDDDGATAKQKQDQGLQFPPRQCALGKMTALIMKMQDKNTGLSFIRQNFQSVCDAGGVKMTGGLKEGAPDAFTANALIEWLSENMDFSSHLEACHFATMLCKSGYIYPCSADWNSTSIKLTHDDVNIYRFQSPYYWPSETLSASESDHACYLFTRDTNTMLPPLNEYEAKYLTKLEKILSHQWGYTQKASSVKERLLEQCCITDQYIVRWQESAYWKINRPQCYHRCAGNPTSDNWNQSLRGLNRNMPPIAPKQSGGKKEKKSLGLSPSKVLKASCTRIVSVCTEWDSFDPLMPDEPKYTPWKSDTIAGAWTKQATLDTGPYRMQCKSWASNFDVLLKDDLGLSYFTEHLKKEYSEENLSFYLECVYLRSAPQSEIEELLKSIFTEFLSPNSATPINIDTQTMNNVKQEMKKNKTRYTFDSALEHIYKLMKKDSYKRFIGSPIYKEALANSKEPTKASKEKMRLPNPKIAFYRVIIRAITLLRIWRLSQFLPKNKTAETDIETGK